ncbi:hypothetical protein [Ruminococcus bicirculans (ex Wegman et al. 2014)]|uniref:hypothetical protein n=1 Tax=Ruminococcus bicirculans (ex Wegman et al. 2014) TaxID=1160721 RepID=UPI003FEE1810
MTITLNADYDVTLNTALLGYVGETNARPVSVEGLTVDGADRYVLTIDYGDGVTYEVDITGGTWTPTADILRSAQTVSCQICAKKLSGDEYILVKKSRIFRLRIGAAIGDTAIPSPSVAADALDKIDAIGRQAHADMQTAVTAAETAKTAAENAEKSATAAEKSADTAGQAAKRAETAQASAETSATQAETARQGAETARAEAVTSQNNAKISAAQAATSAQQTEADKIITAGYAKTAKTNADSTAADKQAVQTLAEQVTADKATVADHAAKVAENRTAAETAAQTAQSIADSLPDDYVTAVAKIAENTAEIANVKLTDKELQRRVNALYDMGNGVTHKFETDSETAYAKTVPTGAKLMSVKSIGGHSEVIDGEIVSTGVTEVVEQGKNLWDEVWGIGSINASSGNDEGSNAAIYSKNYTPITSNSTYIFAYAGSASFENVKTRFYDHSKNYIGYNDNNGQTVYPNSAFITPLNAAYVRFTLPPGYGNAYENDIALIAGSSGTYAPFHRNEYPIPEAIKALPGYGWSAGTAKNYVDYENKRYVQCVNSVDLGTKNWLMYKDGDYTPFFYLNAGGISDIRGGTSNFLCPKYQYAKIGVTDSASGLYVLENTTVRVRDTAYTDAATFKQAMQGVILYYELEKPIVTDISTLIPDDFLRNIEVEAGGSVTFKGGNDDYRIPVPNEEEYIMKLSEVGGTT